MWIVIHNLCIKLKYNKYVCVCIYIYIYIKYSCTQLYILLDYNSSYMFWPNCRAIFRLIFEQVECTIDNAVHLLDLILQDLGKIIVVCYIYLKIKI